MKADRIIHADKFKFLHLDQNVRPGDSWIKINPEMRSDISRRSGCQERHAFNVEINIHIWRQLIGGCDISEAIHSTCPKINAPPPRPRCEHDASPGFHPLGCGWSKFCAVKAEYFVWALATIGGQFETLN
jgi:hypothetical protein